MASLKLLSRFTPRSAGTSTCRLVGLLGEGGMARVYLGRHEGLGRQVAVKRLQPELADQASARRRLRAEAELVRSIDHRHVVSVLDAVDDPDGESYFVMEHLPGEPLATRLARVGALPLSEALLIALQVAGALEAIHRRGILHRDLKSENVLVGLDEAGAMVAKLIDFGVAEVLGQSGTVYTEARVGTPEVMSPEQAIGGAIDLRSDIYSYGTLLYEMVTGSAPFRDPDVNRLIRRLVTEAPVPPSLAPGSQRQAIPPTLDRLILDCLAKAPADRPPDMGAVRRELMAIAAEYRRQVEAVERALNEEDAGPSEARPVIPVWLGDPGDSARAQARRSARAHAEGVRQRHPDAPVPAEDLPIDDEPEPLVHLPQRRAEVLPAAPRGSSRAARLARLLAAAVCLSLLVVGILAIWGVVPWSPSHLQFRWSP